MGVAVAQSVGVEDFLDLYVQLLTLVEVTRGAFVIDILIVQLSEATFQFGLVINILSLKPLVIFLFLGCLIETIDGYILLRSIGRLTLNNLLVVAHVV